MQLTSQQEALIEEYLAKNLAPEEIEAGKFRERIDEKHVRMQLAELDLEFFNRFYLSHHFSLPPAPIHRTLTRKLQDLIDTPGRRNGVYVMPRGHAKTTIATLGLPLWCACFQKRRHIPLISDSFDQAKDQLETVKLEFEENDSIVEDFSELRGEVWQAADIRTSNGVRIRALGQGMKIRGRKIGRDRPDLIICDDLEELEAVQSPTQRQGLKRWFKGSLMRAGWTDTKVVVAGNFLHHDCLLMDLVANPLFDHVVWKALEEWPIRMDLWDGMWRHMRTDLSDPEKEEHARAFFEENKAAMLQGARSAWPEAYPVYELMELRASEGEYSFNMELQNNPQDPTRQLLKRYHTFRMEMRRASEAWIIPLNGRPDVMLSDCTIFGFTDPSMGETTRACKSAISLIAKAPYGTMFSMEADIEIRQPHEIIKAQDFYALRYPITLWGIEKNQFQALFASASASESAEKGVYLPIVAVTQSENKDLRIQSLQPDLENGYLLLPENGQEELKKELGEWPSGAYRDGPDALEGCRRLAKEWQPIMSSEQVQAEVHDFGRTTMPSRGGPGVPADPYAEWDVIADERLADQLARAGAVERVVEQLHPGLQAMDIRSKIMTAAGGKGL